MAARVHDARGLELHARRQHQRRRARRQHLRRQDLWRRAVCQVTATSASSPRPRRQQQWHRDKSLDFEILPSEIYL